MTIDLDNLYTKQFLENYNLVNWRRSSNLKKMMVLVKTKNVMLKALGVPLWDRCWIQKMRDQSNSRRATFQAHRIRGLKHIHTIRMNDEFILNGVVDDETTSKYGQIIDVAAVAAFSGIIHECIHISQDYVVDKGNEQCRKLEANSLNGNIDINFHGKIYSGSTYLSIPFTLNKDSRKIARAFYQLQFREREAHIYMKKAMDLLMRYIEPRYQEETVIGLKKYCGDTADLKVTQTFLEDHFGCDDIRRHIDRSLALLWLPFDQQEVVAKEIPAGILDSIKCLSILTADPYCDVEYGYIRKA